MHRQNLQVSWVAAEAARLPLDEATQKRIEKLKEIMQAAEGVTLDWLPESVLIREGEFMTAGSEDPVYVLLFADRVAIATLNRDGTILVHGLIPLARATLNLRVLNAESPDRFQLWGASNVSFKLDIIPPSPKVATVWKNDLRNLIMAASPNVDNVPGWQHWRTIGTLHSAAFHGDTDFIKEHAQPGSQIIDLNLRDAEGMAPIHLATIAGRDTAVTLLLDAGADVTALAANDDSLLHLAVRTGNFNLVKLFLQAGVNVNQSRQSDGGTPLHEACVKAQRPDIVETLIIAGAWPNVPLTTGETPLQLALKVNRPNATGKLSLVSHALTIACLLLAHGARTPVPLADWIDSCNIDETDLTPLVVANTMFTERIEPIPSESDNRLRIVDDVFWEPDASSNKCRACATPFWFVLRRHHCRACGKLVCYSCSSKTLNMCVYKQSKDHTMKPTRVCDGCFNRVMHQLVNDAHFS